MELLKVLAVPFQAGSLLFVATSSLLLALVTALGGSSPVAALFLAWLMLTWLTNYALHLIDDVANGTREARAASIEMITHLSIDSRCWIHPLIAVALMVIHLLWPAWPMFPMLAAAALLLPASLGACVMSGHAGDALNPVALWRVIRGFGFWYLPLVTFVAACALLGAVLAQGLATGVLLIASLQLLLLTAYAGIGGALYERRLELGFAPRISPERKADLAEQERRARRQHVIDGLYSDLRIRETPRALATARQWLDGLQPPEMADDLRAILDAGRGWTNLREYPHFLQGLMAVLFELRQPGLACIVAETGLALNSNFGPATEPDAIALVSYALETGRRRTAARLLDNHLKLAAARGEQGARLLALRERL